MSAFDLNCLGAYVDPFISFQQQYPEPDQPSIAFDTEAGHIIDNSAFDVELELRAHYRQLGVERTFDSLNTDAAQSWFQDLDHHQADYRDCESNMLLKRCTKRPPSSTQSL